MRPHLPALAIASIVFLLTCALARVPVSPDVSWQLWIAHHLRQGARLYVDIMEVNPPLWFWLAIPVDWLASLIEVRAATMLMAALGMATLVSLIAVERIVEPWIPGRRRAPLLIYAAAAILLMPLADIGQREQYALIGTLPYVALVAARLQGRSVRWPFALAVGIGAGLGFALKHYFLITPVFLEMWLLASLRSGWRPLRPETLGVALVGLAYAVALLLVSPDYLTSMVPMLRLAYGFYSTWRLPQITQILWLLGLTAMVPCTRALIRNESPFAASLLVAAFGYGVAWAIQHKGWPYQAIATSGCLFLALAALLAERKAPLSPVTEMASPAILAIPVALGILIGPYSDHYASYKDWATTGLKPGDSIAFVSSDPALAWPMTTQLGLRYPSRYYGFWMLNSIRLAESGSHDPRLIALGRRVTAETVDDYRCAMPDRIAFARPDTPANAAAFDVFTFFLRDPGFAALMTHYRPWRRIDGLDVYTLATPWPAPPASRCRRGI